MDLPRALAPWALYLNLFPYEIASLLGSFIERLDRILGAFQSQGADDDGDPEGYDGIDRRGNYERLILTEWLLAEELPEEFLRRAASGEHSFLQLARSRPSERRNIVALFDSGPDQLGGPRLVQLAILILLARRADSSGAQLNWGVLQHPEVLITGLNQKSIEKLFSRRVLQEVTSGQIEQWSDRLTNDSSDFWLISKACKTLPGVHRISRAEIEELYVPGDRSLRITVQRNADRPREIILPFPDDVEGARVIRNPFHCGPAPSRNVDCIAFTTNILFSSSGKNFIVGTSPDTVAIYRTPTRPLSQPLVAKTYRTSKEATLIAAGSGIRKAAAILVSLQEPQELCVEIIGGRNHLRCISVSLRTSSATADIDLRAMPGRLVSCLSFDPSEDTLFMALKDLTLLIPLNQGDEVSAIRHVHRPMLAVAGYHGNLSFVDSRSDIGTFNNTFNPVERVSAEPVNCALLGFGGRAALPNVGIVATCTTAGEWIIRDRTGTVKFGQLQGIRVLGVLGIWGKERAGLIVVNEGQPTEPYIMGPDYTTRLPETSSPISHVAVNVYGTIVYTTTLNEIVVFEPGRGLLHRLLPEIS